MSPPLPSLRPTLSFIFLAVRTRSNESLMLDGNWSAGRCHARHSDLFSDVLYCTPQENRTHRTGQSELGTGKEPEVKTDKGELELECRVGVLDDDRPKRLSDPVLGALVVVVVRDVVRVQVGERLSVARREHRRPRVLASCVDKGESGWSAHLSIRSVRAESGTALN